MVQNLLDVGLWHWVAFAALVVVLLAVDLLVFHRRIHTPTLSESTWWSVFWIGLALIFNALVWWWGWVANGDSEAGLAFLQGYLVEKALSVDNLFVFAVIFRFFQVPLKHQYRVLHWGILGAIVFRLVFVLASMELIRRFAWVMWIFAGFLIYTSIRLATTGESQVHPEKNFLLRCARRFFRVTREEHGEKLFARENGLLCMTPLFLVLLVVESSDILFAVDSVPAIFLITQDPFLVFTSNIFAILGLRALYFLLAGVMDRFQYLNYGLSGVLFFIGVKMIVEAAMGHEGPGERVIPHWASLLVIAGLIAGSIVASVIASRKGAPETSLDNQDSQPRG